MIRRHFLEQAGDWDVTLRGLEDYDMWLRLAAFSSFAYITEPLFQYRIHESNMSGNEEQMTWYNFLLYKKHYKLRSYDSLKRLHLRHRLNSFASSAIHPQVFTWINEAADCCRKKQYQSAVYLMKRAYTGYPIGTLCYLTHTMPVLQAIKSFSQRGKSPGAQSASNDIASK